MISDYEKCVKLKKTKSGYKADCKLGLWYPAYQDFMAVLSELDNEKAPEKGLTYDLFESLESPGQ